MRIGSSAFIAVLLLAHADAYASVWITGQTREVEVADTTTIGPLCPPPGCPPESVETATASDAASDLGPWSGTVALVVSAAEIQSTALTGGIIDASGSHTAASQTTIYQVGQVPYAESISSVARSLLEVAFDVDPPSRICVRGALDATGGFAWNSQARITLTGPGGVLLDHGVATDPTCTPPDCFDPEPISFRRCELLASGGYTLRAETSGDAYSFRFANEFIDSSSSASFDLTVNLAPSELPALSGPGRWSAAILLLLTAARWGLPRARRAAGSLAKP